MQHDEPPQPGQCRQHKQQQVARDLPIVVLGNAVGEEVGVKIKVGVFRPNGRLRSVSIPTVLIPLMPDRPTSYSRRNNFKISIYSAAPLPPINTMRRAVRPVACHSPGRRRTARSSSMTHKPAAVPRLA